DQGGRERVGVESTAVQWDDVPVAVDARRVRGQQRPIRGALHRLENHVDRRLFGLAAELGEVFPQRRAGRLLGQPARLDGGLVEAVEFVLDRLDLLPYLAVEHDRNRLAWTGRGLP